MTYPDAIRFLYSLQVFGARPGLETTRGLAAQSGNPQDQLSFIHVAGTNGKGSTCAMLESIYRAAGLRVGLFTSPHLVSFRERIQLNRQLISEADVARLVVELRALLPADQATPITLFEFVTVMALRHFAEQRCDLVIWETGLGGRLDATNIVTPLASVITNIGLDHQQWLGDTLAKIAAEKAGIIKPGVPVLTATQSPEALAAIAVAARQHSSPLTQLPTAPQDRVLPQVSLLGEHQRHNAALAVAAAHALRKTIPVSDETIRRGLDTVRWPGRLQVLNGPKGQDFLIDGAHNVAGTEMLAQALRDSFPEEKPTIILGVLGDKNWRAMCEILAPLAVRLLLVPVGSERSARPEDLAEACRTSNPRAEVLRCNSLPDALTRATEDPFVVITGSLYLAGEALSLLDPDFREVANERGLNDWRAIQNAGHRPEPDSKR